MVKVGSRMLPMDNIEPNEPQLLLRLVGLRVEPTVVTKVVEVIRQKAPLAPLWKGKRLPNGHRGTPVCAKGTVKKIKSPYGQGKLDGFLTRLCANALA